MSKCTHEASRLWDTGKGNRPVRRCKSCGAIRPLTERDKQLIKNDPTSA